MSAVSSVLQSFGHQEEVNNLGLNLLDWAPQNGGVRLPPSQRVSYTWLYLAPAVWVVTAIGPVTGIKIELVRVVQRNVNAIAAG